MEENLDELFEQYIRTGTPEEKAELAESYLDMFHEMCYDFSCDKLSSDSIFILEDIVEKIEQLQNEIFWELRTQAYHVLLSDAESRKDATEVVKYGKRTIEACNRQLEETTETHYRFYEQISYCHYSFIEFIPGQAGKHWEESLHFIKKAIQENPDKADWVHFLKLLYSALPQESIPAKNRRSSEISAFNTWCLSLPDNGTLNYRIASAFIRLKEFMSYSEELIFSFPEEEYFFWLEKSMKNEIKHSTTSEATGIGHFYHREGTRMFRIDILEKAFSYFEKAFYEYDEYFAIYYVAYTLEEIAMIYRKQSKYEEADRTMINVLEWYEGKQELFEENYSLLFHYAEFLERCYVYQGNIPKPTLLHILAIVKKTEELGQGFYSGPYFIQLRMALVQNQERTAVVFLCQALLLHELCIEELVKNFYDDLPKGDFPYLQNFLEKTLEFMKEVREGYYFSPEIKFEKLNQMTDDEIFQGWVLRKLEIKKRRG